jgi:hypothetical protein
VTHRRMEKKPASDLSPPPKEGPESDGPLRRKSQLTKIAPVVHPNKIHPVATSTTSLEEDGDGKQHGHPKQETHSWRPKLDLKALLLRLFMVLVVGQCIAWTAWLIMLNVAPNDTVMNTKHFDDGAFWMLVESPQALVGLATFGLAVVLMLYIAVLVQLVTTRSRCTW